MRPNILWFCSDQQRYDTIGAFGNPHIRTPTIDRLIAQGIGFTHAFAQSPVCTPSRATFLTGRYPATHHVHRNGGARFPDGEVLVTRLFREAGYECGLIGKLHLAAALKDREPRANDGYGTFLWSHHPGPEGPAVNAYHDWLRQEKGADPVRLFGGPVAYNSPGVTADLQQSTWAAEMGIRFIERNRGQPWLLSVNIFAPHPPFDPPADYLARYDPATLPPPLFRHSDIDRQKSFAHIPQQSLEAADPSLDEPDDIERDTSRLRWAHRPPRRFNGRRAKASYYASIEFLDHQLGRMIAALEASGQLDRTIVVFMSDHGELLGDHGLLYKGCRFFEGLVRVPLVFSWPGCIRQGARSGALVELVDVAPTLLDLAGIAVPPFMQGRSLANMLTGRASVDHHKNHVTAEYNDAMGSTPLSTYVHASMYRDRRYKMIRYHGLDLGELFDLENDPGEFDNLWSDRGACDLKMDLLARHFDAMMATSAAGVERVAMG
jgi:arylsulfatase A-like enzyme